MASVDDVDSIASLIRQAAPAARDLGRDRWLARLAEQEVEPPAGAVFVACEHHTVVGFGRVALVSAGHELYWDGAPTGWFLLGLLVAPQLRRRGVGEQLARRRLAWAAKRTTEMFSFTRRTNVASIALHRKLGFEVVTEQLRVPGVYDDGDGVLFRLASISRASY